ncbi:polysaccharide lyase family 3 protein [Trematosphaeria pertusa]|uniref:Pectate lyase n=1 Tax=Trematosphaeria pertusa TaxID=390896 RepID=A0A6A6HRV5_9PLEO|nr:polysaccharide lyase family 3 protein [Trematosphaeria pertusa]KAF2240180.1 polysaccharide lyase family 3 protein [Trematosphaeria pertusa]
MFFASILALAAGLPSALACLGYEGGLPVATGTTTVSAPIEVAAGQVYDGGWRKFQRTGYTCKNQEEGGTDKPPVTGSADTMFILRKGATLRNVIIGQNQGEGVYCYGGCNLEFVWFEDVCEDAISIRDDGPNDQTWIVGGGAYHASDKIIQHNGCGKVNVINFYAEDYGKVYRACGTCTACKRTVYLEGVTARDGGEVAGINIGDSATLKNICTDAKTPCQLYSAPGVKAGAC